MEAETHKNLPICWDMIFDKLNNPSDRDSISLVCKEFLSITNLIQESLTVFSPSINVLASLLRRFPHLKKIKLLNFQGDLNRAFHNLGSTMKNLKILGCSRSSMKDSDLVKIANFFPQLEEINISDSYFPHIVDSKIIAVTDEGIEFLASKLKRLRKVVLSGNRCISDKSLISLSLNCPFLQHIVAGYSTNITECGISFLLRNSPRLTSLCLMAHFKIGSFGVENSINFPKHLVSLKFVSLNISDEFLHSVAKAQIPLTELTLSFCKSYTFSGISSLLHSHRYLRSLALLGAEFLTNEHIDYLCQFLLNLSSIQLYCCPLLSDSAFVMLSERCNLLSRLEIGYSCVGSEEWNNVRPLKNLAIRSLNLSSNQFLGSANLRKVQGIFPNLEKLNLSKCFQGTEMLDVADILDYSHTVKSLELNECRQLTFSREKAKVSKLEKLVAKYSGINDEVLAMIGRNSPRLLYLDLEDCENITEKGVKEVIESCKRLRYLSLSGCSNVNVDVVEYIVDNEPSLRRLISPSCGYPEEEDQIYLLQDCLVTRGVDYEEFI
ncbi:F-box/LRR-repeat protein 14-like [Silene latifolia]|uniref:F-box/LRR-repeat protein 14-like n=1 Tax=Silene latifolia TaxID=37657 RepID=UPI003D775ABA